MSELSVRIQNAIQQAGWHPCEVVQQFIRAVEETGAEGIVYMLEHWAKNESSRSESIRCIR